MRWWPRSLVGQLMLAVALTLFVAQSANLWLLARAQREQFLVQVGGMVASRVIDALDRERRGDLVDGDANNPRARVSVSMEMPQPPAMSRAIPALALHVRGSLTDANVPAQQVVAWHVPALRERRSGRAIGTRAMVSIYDGKRWITIRARAPMGGERLSSLLIGQTLLLYLVLLVPILFVGWRVSRPLSELTNSVRLARPGDRAEPLQPRGPSDVHDLMAAFNLFRGRIDTMMSDKDRMLGAVGHDLRTPLASLRVRVEQVSDGELRTKMIASIEEMASMLTDILALARSGAGVELSSRINLGTWLDEMAADYSMRGLVVSRISGDDDSAFVGRPILLARAVRNLIDNALAYGERAYIQLSREEKRVVIIIADDGPGIAAEKINGLIEAFARGEESRNRATGGSGLGLAIAKMIVEGEGGMLELVNREDGQGLDARIILPLQQ